ncbi:MAG TPA: DNA cytosine methyltransferase, partial [Ktedonobacteraceae bacterium]|nr:DNA cytosine methyltransferase [Ktedonobacteraceae bacterium]
MESSMITVTDLFCGAGGSSTGAVQAGAEVRLAINHWDRAIKTHNTNHPNTTHVLTDISTADPRRFPSTTILLASPECTNHSLARGVERRNQRQLTLPGMDGKGYDPAAERSRCLMWTPLVFAERHRYPMVILENVVDAYDWILFNAWRKAWEALEYQYEMVFFNSMFA